MSASPRSQSFPPWLKKRLPMDGTVGFVRDLLRELGLSTVCQSAKCPNIGECFSKRTATFMIMGHRCTRSCGFCAVDSGNPTPLDPREPERVAEAVGRLELRHTVITSVTRDDLADQGAGHFAETIEAVRGHSDCVLEVLTPDFGGQEELVDRVAKARPTIYNHNVETVPRLYRTVRPQACYERSLRVIERAKELDATILTKSGVMVGLGEASEEVDEVMADLRSRGCDILTIGQYLRPSPDHLAIRRFVPPVEFEAMKNRALSLGFRAVASGPFVRSSYNAEEVFAGVDT